VESLDLSAYDAGVIVNDAIASSVFEGVLEADPSLSAKTVANWVTGELLRLVKGAGGTIDATEIATLIKLVSNGAISGTNAKEVLAEHFASGTSVASIVEARGFRQISDAGALGVAIDTVLAANPAAVADYRAGTTAAVGFLVGQVMKATRGQANAAMVQTALRDRLDKAE
jgi:aspartyl-tRNA(Asn)/glutamyl-tRNA(Gln) amidotransferase subunit B